MQLLATGLQHSFSRQKSRDADRAPLIQLEKIEALPGELTLFTGPSGSGKTTLLHMLSGLLKPQQGQVRWEDTDLAEKSETLRDKWRRDHAGLVFQDFFLIEGMSAFQNVVMPAYFSRFFRGDSGDVARRLLEKFGIREIYRPVETYSRGEQQRIAIARALIFDPPVIFADEPTASLDAENASSIAETLLNLAKSGKAVLAVSHDRGLIDQADRLYRLEHGRLVSATPGGMIS